MAPWSSHCANALAERVLRFDGRQVAGVQEEVITVNVFGTALNNRSTSINRNQGYRRRGCQTNGAPTRGRGGLGCYRCVEPPTPLLAAPTNGVAPGERVSEKAAGFLKRRGGFSETILAS
eukprot:1286501-Pyramimonas_sp.AAC.1